MQRILLHFGARPGLKVRATGCEHGMQRVGPFAWVKAEFSTLAPGEAGVTQAEATAVAALAGTVVVDAGPGVPPTELLGSAAHSLLVTRACYLALRRAVRLDATRRSAGIVLVEEPGRALGVRDVADVLGRPVIGRLPVRDTIAREIAAASADFPVPP